MHEAWYVVVGLAAATFSIRLAGYLLGARLPAGGPWAQGFNALPGCLIAALLTVILIQGSPLEWIAAGLALLVALATKSLPITMVAGIGAIWALRMFA